MKKLMSILVAASLLIALLMPAAFAAGGAVVEVETVTAETGDTVTIEVTMDSLQITNAAFELSYDKSALELTEITNVALEGMGDSNIVTGRIAYMNMSAYTVDGVVFTATFKVLTSTAGEYTVAVTADVYDEDMNSVSSSVTDGSVTIEEPEVPATGVEITTNGGAALNLVVGGTTKLEVNVTPANTTDEIVFSSSDDDVVSIDDEGNVTAVGAGTATITVTVGDYTDTITVTVTEPEPEPTDPITVTGVTLNKDTLELKKGRSSTLKATVKPDDADNKAVIWSSSDESVATVSQQGKVTAKGVGTATITVTTVDGGFTATCEVTVTASTSPSTGGGGIAQPSMPFTDVNPGDWFYENVRYVYNANLMNGTNDGTTFSPNMNMNRAMLVTVLYRMAGEPAVTAKNTFPDVADGTWYTKAVIWASANGIVTGDNYGNFVPNGNVTREQLATFLYRFAQYKSYDVSVKGDLTTFPDSATTSGWAKEATEWAVSVGVIQGRNGNNLQPTTAAVRSEVAAMLHRFCLKF